MPPVAATPAPAAHPAQQPPNNSPPEAWNVLFPSVQYNPEDRRAILIRELVYGFSSAAGWARLQAGLQRYGDGRFSLDISFRSLQELCPVDGDVSIALELQPVEALACISAAAHQVGFKIYRSSADHSMSLETPCPARSMHNPGLNPVVRKWSESQDRTTHPRSGFQSSDHASWVSDPQLASKGVLLFYAAWYCS